MIHVLITGAGSYIGTSVEQWLNQWPNDYQVDTIDMIDDSWKKKSFSGYDTVFHVAGIVHKKEKPEMYELYQRVNKILPIEVAQKAKNEGVKQFIFMSSMSVYGIVSGSINKETKPNPNTFYGRSKWDAERILNGMGTEEFRIVVLRPPMIYGDGCKGNYQALVKIAQKSPVFPAIKNRRSMCHINVLCERVKELIAQRESGLFFPQDEEYACTFEMVREIAKQKGHQIWITPLLNPFVRIGCKVPGVLGRTLNKAFGSLVYAQE